MEQQSTKTSRLSSLGTQQSYSTNERMCPMTAQPLLDPTSMGTGRKVWLHLVFCK